MYKNAYAFGEAKSAATFGQRQSVVLSIFGLWPNIDYSLTVDTVILARPKGRASVTKSA